MSDAAAPFAKFVPGFDFLQGLMKTAGAALPSMGQWIAPTLDPQELEKRIEELRTVQFWLEQNARMLGATIQALEVQRMTLATLKTMNLPVAELHKTLQMGMPPPPAAPAPAPAPSPAADPDPTAAQAPAPPVVDPVQWWGALTRQFTELAASALKEGSTEAKNLAGSLTRSSFDAVAPKRAAVAAQRAPAAPSLKSAASTPRRKKAARKTAAPSGRSR